MKIEELLKWNEEFVKKGKYEVFETTKYPNKKVAVLSCMDTRLTALLPAALGLKNGDAKLIKNAGGIISHPYGSVMRSLLVCIYQLGVETVLVVGHDDCGMQHLSAEKLLQKMNEHGITKEAIDEAAAEVDLTSWLAGFDCVEQSVQRTVKLIREHPLVTKEIEIYGLVMDPATGALRSLC